MHKTLVILIAAGLLMLTGCSNSTKPTATPTADPTTQRQLTTGGVIGFRDGDNTLAWLGIPYAKAPVGELRWRAPQAPDVWPGVRSATHFGHFCPQLGGMTVDVPKSEYGKVVGTEDCLFLNVCAPATANTPQLPVMVWIHGGGNSIGTANTYTYAHELAGKQRR